MEESNFSEAGFDQPPTYQVHWVSASKFVRAESQLSSSDTSLKCTCFFKHESYVLLIIKYNSMGFFSLIPPEAIPLLQKKFCLLQWAGYHRVMTSKKKAADWSSHTYYIFLYQMHEDINCKKVLMISSLKCRKTIWVFLVWRCLAKHEPAVPLLMYPRNPMASWLV